MIISPAGGQWWRLKYRFGGKEKLLSFGTYPEVSLADARQRRDDARKMVAAGVDPGEFRKEMKIAKAELTENCFEFIAHKWLTKFKKKWSTVHADTIKERLERDVFPYLGHRIIADIKAPELLAVLRRISGQADDLESWSTAAGLDCGAVAGQTLVTAL